MLDQFTHHIHTVCGYRAGDRVLLAVSGGADSMVMMDLFKEAQIDFAVAHMHFGLRGDESDRDSEFVAQQAKLAGVRCYLQRVDTQAYAAAHQLSIETAARNLRYAWFEEIRAAEKYAWVATAHHAQDAAESMLMHLIRGTGLKGMTGIAAVHRHIMRPLLFTTRAAIQGYIQKNQIAYVEDSSNAESVFIRNFVRHQILPACLHINPAFVETMQQNAQNFLEGYTLMQERADLLLNKWKRMEGDCVYIPVKPIVAHEAALTLLYTWLSPYGFNQQQLQHMLTGAGKSGNQFLSAHFRLVTTKSHFILCHRDTQTITPQFIERDTHTVSSGKWKLTLSELDMSPHIRIQNSKQYVYFDAAKLSWPLQLRAWQKGDYMYPFGLFKNGSNKPAKKKLSDLFSDAKYALTEKENALVLCSGEHIIWVAGLRQDGRFMVTRSTTRVLRISIQ